MQTIRPSRPRQSDSIEEGAFKEQILSRRVHATVLTAHDTGNRQRPVMIGDDQRIRSQDHFLPIEQDEPLPFLGHPHPNAALDLREIECVQWLPEFQHDVIGDIHYRIDAANIGAAQTLHHPLRCRDGEVDAADDATEITGTGIRSQYVDGPHLIVPKYDGLNLKRLDWGAIYRTHLASKTSDR